VRVVPINQGSARSLTALTSVCRTELADRFGGSNSDDYLLRVSHFERCADAWEDLVSCRGGSLLSAVDPDMHERADLGAAFRTSTGARGEAYRLGVVHLDGRLAAFDPVTLQGFELGVTAPRGQYPTYVIVAEGDAELLLIRLGGSYPTDWYEVDAEVDGGMIPIDSGAYALAATALVDEARKDPAIRSRLREAAVARALGPVDVDPTLGGAVFNTLIGGDCPAWCYLGLDAESHVVAIAITLITDYVDGTRPASEDAELLRMLTERADALTGNEELAEMWTDLTSALSSSGGRVTFEIRAYLHSLHEGLERRARESD
jgi:hypothetical protein